MQCLSSVADLHAARELHDVQHLHPGAVHAPVIAAAVAVAEGLQAAQLYADGDEVAEARVCWSVKLV